LRFSTIASAAGVSRYAAAGDRRYAAGGDAERLTSRSVPCPAVA